MDLATFDWLLTDAGQALLGVAADALEEPHPVRRAEVVRRAAPASAPAGAAAAALSVATLRVRGRAKLGADADRLYLTPDALEQATRTPVATHRAARLAAFAPAGVVDLGCSVGGDLIALARAGLVVVGVDLDPVRVAMARANLAALDLPGAVAVADATTVDLGPFGAAFCDPARRGGGGRTFRVESWAPPWSFVTGLLTRSRVPAVVKAAPGLPHDLVPDGVEAEWVSCDHEVKEAVLWAGPLATTTRRATVISGAGLATLTAAELPAGDPPVGPVGRYLVEPDGAVIRAGLVGAVADLVGGRLLDPHIAYVTTDAEPRTPYGRAYEVLEELPYREKPLKAALRERRVGRLTIKKRGVDVVPERLRPRLALSGDREATLVLTRVDGRGAALLVAPLDAGPPVSPGTR